jgi:hypothetical protein
MNGYQIRKGVIGGNVVSPIKIDLKNYVSNQSKTP